MVGIKEAPYYLWAHTNKKHKVYSQVLLSEMDIRLSISNKKPFVAGKIGGFELWAMRVAEFGYAKEERKAYEKLSDNAGFFSDTSNIHANLYNYNERMKDTISTVDYLIRWQYPKEEYFVKKYCPGNLKDIDWLGVVYENEPIGRILRNRKVLAVTPFASAVERQYSRREKIYPDEYLPDFDLQTYKAVQTIAGNRDPRYANWFEALDSMIKEIEKLDFDIALVGCGAYSLPLCAAIKKMGKSAIHMGGDLQLLFGIMGKRWEEDPFVQEMRNDYWIYPEKGDIPNNSNIVEDGCYW
ncbi:MAG: hypothetical protein IJR29_09015 [Butyrivibrio sp.]|nr:hypothetical protein [Butyrivibrio sp.]